ncbi:MAG TPA: glutamine--fructose-6-phosphate transaminase (isomerizing) [Pyrodictium sp.]|nr:glutamine--fructose-6-phosphate transaminase (isomerizing) [Pyrodictium sp.]HIQ55511.1 glutamine--fructose-6-phosphate transaminase (isomerizing) [Pyrodictium sp.]
MCGIVGIVSEDINIVPLLVRSLKRLEYRGYDSAGFAFVIEGKIVVLKDRGYIDHVVKEYNILSLYSNIGIAHTRWATHGQPSKANAHPHTDCGGLVAVVHNGIISNYVELKQYLEEKGHIFRSETDTEVIAHLLEEYIVNEKLTPLQALHRLVKTLKGTYAIALLYAKTPNRIYFAKNVSPLILAVSPTYGLLASDIPSLIEYSRKVVVVEDGEYGFVEPGNIVLYRDGKVVNWRPRIHVVGWSVTDIEKAGYPHFMLKEIMEQPRALYDTYSGALADENIVKAAKLIIESNKIFITGAGTSYHAGLTATYYFARIANQLPYTFISSEADLYADLASEETVLIAISQSGETIDTLKAVRLFKERGAKIIAISNVIGSAIPREADVTVYTRAGPEIGVAATKTYLTQILILQYIAISTGLLKGLYTENDAKEYIKLLGQAPKAVEQSLQRASPHINRLAMRLHREEHMYILGRLLGAFLALEAALKIKEVSYIHAEAYPAGESKHGPIALVQKGFPTIFIGTPPVQIVEKIASNIEEMMSRGAFTILIGLNCYEDVKADFRLLLGPCNEYLAPYYIMPPLQLLAYRLAVLRGYDPDKPRNLAKTVTVE